MIHEIKYTLKTLFRSKEFMFWMIAFPLILGTLFYFAFSNLGKNQEFEPIPIAVVTNDDYEKSYFKSSLEQLSKPGEEHFFTIEEVSEENLAKDLVLENKVIGYLRFSPEPNIVLGNNSFRATMFHQIISQMKQLSTVINQVSEDNNDFEVLVNSIIAQYQENNYELVEKSKSSKSPVLISFYSLIAMTCLYGAVVGMSVINPLLPQMSQTGKRISVSSSKKTKQILGAGIAGFVGQLLAVTTLFLHLNFILKVDFGDDLPIVYLFTVVGSIAGITFGIFQASVIKVKEELKAGIIISSTMLGSFLSGMMGPEIKFLIDKNVPFVNWINPSNMITDGLYSLSTYSTYDRFLFNLFSLLVFTFIMFICSIWALRRQTYDSI